MTDFLIAPSILSADFARLGDEIRNVERAGADWIHVDVMDGHFVPNLTIGAPVVKCLRPITTLPLDVHLMIDEPEKYVDAFADAGADYLTIHVEATQNPGDVIQKIRNAGVKPGITLRPATPVEDLMPYLKDVDLILIMTVNPGFGGQSFMADQVEKIKAVRQELMRLNSAALIEVDGGINPTTAIQCRDADVLVAGNAIFKTRQYAEAIAALKKARHE